MFKVYGKPETGIISCVWKGVSTFDTNKCISSYYSVGYPVPGVQIKIIHPQTEKSRSVHKLGEICVKSAQMVDKSRNVSIVTRNAFTIDGFYKTGDAGYYDTDGQLYVECRVNELIYESNNAVNPLPIESILRQHSAVKEAAVIGVPDDTYGQVCCGFVELEPKVAVSEQTLIELVSNKGKELRAGIRFIESMPKTLRNQVNRMALRVIYDNFHTYSLIEML
jgi:acyl-coenzyme A synthetase/AMP-(fatty) acid ligase